MRLPSNGKGARSKADLMKIGPRPQPAAAPRASRIPREVPDPGSGASGLLASPLASTIGAQDHQQPSGGHKKANLLVEDRPRQHQREDRVRPH